jgi:OmpA-OmpF porin, OOP family
MRLRVTLLAASLAVAASTARAADPVPSLDLRGFHPPMDPAGFLYLEPASTPGPWNWNVGATASYALRPVVLTDASGSTLASAVAHQASIDYTVNVGLGQTWAVGLSVPTVVYQTGDDVTTLLPGSTELPHTAIGALALGVKKTVVTPSDLGGLGISLLGRVYVPTSPTSYVSDRTVSGELRGLGELDLLALAFRATAGVHVRGATETYVPDPEDRYRFGHDLPWGVGVTLRPQALGVDRGGHLRISAEARGAIAITPSFAAGPQSPVLAGLSARYTAGEVSGILGAEVPINDAVGNPIVRPVLGVGWAPRFIDEDGDGIEDEKDECPELAEDQDGFEDQDGCPDFDNDDDGVSDDDDKCPKEKEDADDFQDDDGCADPDNDGDGVLDAADACPNEAGPANGPRPGCPDPDPDHDGVLKEKDKCPNEPEDKDGFQDGDGCPDPDNDGDGVPDTADACPMEKGEASAIPELNGCVIADHDGDTFDDAVDECPREPEDFDGIEDEDGCPDAKPGAKPLPPLVTIEASGDARSAKLRVAPRFVKDDVDPKTLPPLRALAQTLNANPTWIVAVGARPAGHTAAAEQAALNRSFAIALTLRWLTHRDACAETVGWGAVQDLPGAAPSGLGLLILAPKSEAPAPAAPAPAPAAPAPAPAPAAPAPAQAPKAR